MSKFIVSQRGARHLSYRGFRYRLNGAGSAFSQPWRCTVEKCKGKASTPKPHPEGCRVITSGEHNHAPDPAREDLAAVTAAVKQRADEGLAPRRIISEEIVGLSQEARGRMNIQNLKRSVRRVRAREGGLPPNPAPNEKPVIPQQFTVTSRGDRFLLYDSMEVEQDDDEDVEETGPRILIFSSENQLRILGSSRHVQFDGTFKVTPAQFYQLFVIHAVRDGVILPCVFCCTEDKSQDTYTSIFKIIKDRLPEWSPETAMCDFELSAIRAFGNEYPQTNITGCLFHLSQSVYRQAVDRGLKRAYVDDEVIRNHVKFLPALAFIPEDDVSDTFSRIQDSADFPQNDEIQDLYDYFETTYVGREIRGGRRRVPRFPPRLWNQHSRMTERLGRTNNMVEAWHRGIQASLDGSHPSLWKFLKFLQLEEGNTITTDAQITGGIIVRREKQDQMNRTARIMTIMSDYRNRSILDFLRGISYNIAIS